MTAADRGFSFPTFLVVCLLIFLGVLFGSGLLRAQTNPYTVRFSASVDHDAVEHGAPVLQRYELVVRAPGASSDMAPINLGKPTPTGGQLNISIQTQMAALPASPNCNLSAPTPATCYIAVVRSIGASGGASSASSPFALNPRAPAAIVGPVDVSRQ